jgi:hypothetical protein
LKLSEKVAAENHREEVRGGNLLRIIHLCPKIETAVSGLNSDFRGTAQRLPYEWL